MGYCRFLFIQNAGAKGPTLSNARISFSFLDPRLPPFPRKYSNVMMYLPLLVRGYMYLLCLVKSTEPINQISAVAMCGVIGRGAFPPSAPQSVASVGLGWWGGLWASVCVAWVCRLSPSGNYLCISRDNFCTLGSGKAWKSH